MDTTGGTFPIGELGERRWKQDDNNFYERGYSVPIRALPVGTCTFAFASGDDGWLFDVGIASTVAMMVSEAKVRSLFPGIRPVPAVVTAKATLLRTRELKEAEIKLKTTTPRPAGKARLVRFSDARKIPFESNVAIR